MPALAPLTPNTFEAEKKVCITGVLDLRRLLDAPHLADIQQLEQQRKGLQNRAYELYSTPL